jgi:hypothetical protein
MAAFDVLRRYLDVRGTFTAEQIAFIQPLFVVKTLDTGDFLQRA